MVERRIILQSPYLGYRADLPDYRQIRKPTCEFEIAVFNITLKCGLPAVGYVGSKLSCADHVNDEFRPFVLKDGQWSFENENL